MTMTDEEVAKLVSTIEMKTVSGVADEMWGKVLQLIEKLQTENAALCERLSHSLELPCMAKLEIVDDNDKHIKYIYFIFYKENGKFSSIKYLNKGAAESELAKLKGEKK